MRGPQNYAFNFVRATGTRIRVAWRVNEYWIYLWTINGEGSFLNTFSHTIDLFIL